MNLHTCSVPTNLQRRNSSALAVKVVLEGGKNCNCCYLLTVAKVYSTYGGFSEATKKLRFSNMEETDVQQEPETPHFIHNLSL